MIVEFRDDQPASRQQGSENVQPTLPTQNRAVQDMQLRRLGVQCRDLASGREMGGDRRINRQRTQWIDNTYVTDAPGRLQHVPGNR